LRLLLRLLTRGLLCLLLHLLACLLLGLLLGLLLCLLLRLLPALLLRRLLRLLLYLLARLLLYLLARLLLGLLLRLLPRLIRGLCQPRTRCHCDGGREDRHAVGAAIHPYLQAPVAGATHFNELGRSVCIARSPLSPIPDVHGWDRPLDRSATGSRSRQGDPTFLGAYLHARPMFLADPSQFLVGRRRAQAVAILAALALGHQLVAVDIAVVPAACGPGTNLLPLRCRRRRRRGSFDGLSPGRQAHGEQTESQCKHDTP